MAGKKDPFQIKALFGALGGFFVVMVLLNFMNGEIQYSKKKNPSSVEFKTKKITPKPQQKLVRKKKKQSKKSVNRSLKPKLNMAFASSGLNLGIDILGLSAGDSKLLSQSGDAVMTEDIVDRLPEIRYRESIPYPASAKEKNINGFVTVNILVTKTGEVDQVRLLESQPEGIFDQVTLQAVKLWSFSPAEYKGQMVSVWVKQKLKFQVN